jgi:hypothetical protein
VKQNYFQKETAPQKI